jgi:hypothetical protein
VGGGDEHKADEQQQKGNEYGHRFGPRTADHDRRKDGEHNEEHAHIKIGR